jgi:hypothetical protein
MNNDNTTPVLTLGTLPRKCYSDPQQFAEDLVKVIKIPSDTYSVINGAKGEPGKSIRGPSGPQGLQGPAGAGATLYLRIIEIPSAATYVDFVAFTDWQKASFSICHKGVVGSTGSPPIVYNPGASGVIAVGTTIGIAPLAASIRVYFIFGGGITSTPDANHVLHIISTTPI